MNNNEQSKSKRTNWEGKYLQLILKSSKQYNAEHIQLETLSKLDMNVPLA